MAVAGADGIDELGDGLALVALGGVFGVEAKGGRGVGVRLTFFLYQVRGRVGSIEEILCVVLVFGTALVATIIRNRKLMAGQLTLESLIENYQSEFGGTTLGREFLAGFNSPQGAWRVPPTAGWDLGQGDFKTAFLKAGAAVVMQTISDAWKSFRIANADAKTAEQEGAEATILTELTEFIAFKEKLDLTLWIVWVVSGVLIVSILFGEEIKAWLG